jgi:hypothetical protein
VRAHVARQQGFGVEVGAIDVSHAEVEGAGAETDELTLFEGIALMDEHPGKERVARTQAVRMANGDVQGATDRAGEDDHPRGRGHDRRARGGDFIDPAIPGGIDRGRWAEVIDDHAVDRRHIGRSGWQR